MPSASMTRQLDKEQAVGFLNHLNAKELQELLDSDSRIDDLVRDNSQVKALDAEKQSIVASNKSLSEFNLSREPRLTQGKERLSASHEKAAELYRTCSAKKSQVENNSSDTSVEEALALLKTAAESIDMESEILSEQFLDGKLNIETFLESYIEKRTVAHARKIKAEKMAELMRQKPPHQMVNSAPQAHAAPVPQSWQQPMAGMYNPSRPAPAPPVPQGYGYGYNAPPPQMRPPPMANPYPVPDYMQQRAYNPRR